MLWRPHNYRRALKKPGIFKALRIPILKQRGDTPNKQNNTIAIKYPKVTVTVYKNTVVGTYNPPRFRGAQETYLLTGTVKEIEDQIAKKKEEIKEEIDSKIIKVCAMGGIHGISIYIKWVFYEDFLKGEEYISKLPGDLIVHGPSFKKVYKEGVEFVKTEKEEPGAHLSNFIHNAAIKKISPLIAEELRKIHEEYTPRMKKPYKEAFIRLLDAMILYFQAQVDKQKEGVI